MCCITPALDGYIWLLNRTPCTWMIMSFNICGTVSYDLWHPCSHLLLLYFHPTILLPSSLLLSKLTTHGHQHPGLIPMKIGYHPHVSQPQPDLWHLSLWRKMCGECSGRETIGTLKETRCHSWKIVFKEMIQFSLMCPPSGSLHSNIKRLHSYYWKRNIQDHYFRKPHHF